jgi:hypothetical protein
MTDFISMAWDFEGCRKGAKLKLFCISSSRAILESESRMSA